MLQADIRQTVQASLDGCEATLLQRWRDRLATRLPGVEDELQSLFQELNGSGLLVLCADANDIVLFHSEDSELPARRHGSGRRTAIRWLGLDWRTQIQSLGGRVASSCVCVPAPDQETAAKLIALTGSGANAPQRARALAGACARALANRAKFETGSRMEAPLARGDGPELLAHRTRLEAAERVAGDDPVVTRSLMMAQKLVTHRVPILLQGETGTGKEVFAKALHALSDRYVGHFVAVNCAAIPGNRIEAELFGLGSTSVQGQRTPGYRGRIVEADGGVLFLDEVGDLPLSAQARLLHMIEAGEIVPLGSDKAVNVDVEIISATHGDLEEAVRLGHFREDLYYRLSGLRIAMPPLRERSDRRLLFDAILQEESGGRASFEPDALDALDSHHWSGNLRELRNVLRVALAFAEGGVVRAEHLQLPSTQLHEPEGELKDERSRLLREIVKQNWNISAVARCLGTSRNTLYRHMRRLQIAIPGRGDASSQVP